MSPPAAFLRAWDNALPAADLDDVEVRPSLITLDAAVAARLDVVSVLVLDCVSALPAAVLEAFPVEGDFKTLEAAFAALGRVCFVATVLPLLLFLLKWGDVRRPT